MKRYTRVCAIGATTRPETVTAPLVMGMGEETEQRSWRGSPWGTAAGPERNLPRPRIFRRHGAGRVVLARAECGSKVAVKPDMISTRSATEQDVELGHLKCHQENIGWVK